MVGTLPWEIKAASVVLEITVNLNLYILSQWKFGCFPSLSRVDFPWEGILQNAVLITFGQKLLQIFPCSIQKALAVKPENAVLAGTAGVPGKPAIQYRHLGPDPWSSRGIPFFSWPVTAPLSSTLQGPKWFSLQLNNLLSSSSLQF